MFVHLNNKFRAALSFSLEGPQRRSVVGHWDHQRDFWIRAKEQKQRLLGHLGFGPDRCDLAAVRSQPPSAQQKGRLARADGLYAPVPKYNSSWLALLVYRCLSNATSFVLCAFRLVKD